MLNLTIVDSWNPFFETQKKQEYFKKLIIDIENEYQNEVCFPAKNQIFNAFNYCDFNDLKVVIIGQDPYHGEGEANGLCFSVNNGVKIPPSLKNIFIEINNNFNNLFMPVSGNLEHWAKQGILLLNAGLTVKKNQANSHKHLKWSIFTDNVIQHVSENCDNIVFLLWGSFAQKKGAKINPVKHLVLQTGHPSPLSANRGFWFGNEHFIKTNKYLKSINKLEINWF